MAGALAVVRAGPGGGPGAPAGERRGGVARPAGAEAGEEAAVPRRVGTGGEGHRGPRRGGRLAVLHGASADDDAAGAGVSGPPRAVGDRGLLRDRRVPGRGPDRAEEAGDGLAGLRDECPGADAAAGGVGLPGPVSDRGRLVAVEGPVAGPDACLPPG